MKLMKDNLSLASRRVLKESAPVDYKARVQANPPKDLPAVLTKVKAVLAKYKIKATFRGGYEQNGNGKYVIDVVLGRTNIDNEELVDDLNSVVGGNSTIEIMPCGDSSGGYALTL